MAPDVLVSVLETRFDLKLHPANVRVELRDWRWIAMLPDDLIAFIPCTPNGANRLHRERRLLTLLADNLTFEVPRPIGFDPETQLDLRKKVAGITHANLHSAVRAHGELGLRATNEVAGMLSQLHAIPIAEVDLPVGRFHFDGSCPIDVRPL